MAGLEDIQIDKLAPQAAQLYSQNPQETWPIIAVWNYGNYSLIYLDADDGNFNSATSGMPQVAYIGLQ